MSLEDGAMQLTSSTGTELPVIFCTSKRWSAVTGQLIYWKDGADLKRTIKPLKKQLGRGVVCLPMSNHRELLEASLFVKIIEESCNEKIADLEEHAFNRALIKI